LKKVKFSFLILCIVLVSFISSSCLINNQVKPFSEIPTTWRASKTSNPTYQYGYSPQQIRKAYGIDKVTYTGKGQTVAIVVAYGNRYVKKDLDTFDDQFNIVKAKISVKYLGSDRDINPTWAFETDNDVQWAHAIAPDAKLLVVAAKTSAEEDMIQAINYAIDKGANIVSMSWGSLENSEVTDYNKYFNNPNVIFVASSGDKGPGVYWPASVPNVLSVGGTSLLLDSQNNRRYEEAWPYSGGGVSTYQEEPLWQKNVLNLSSVTKRAVPDVSFNANPYTGQAIFDSLPVNGNSGWFVSGGTSLSCACWAGIAAILNDKGDFSINNIYNDHDAGFYDIIYGGNNTYSALNGYDLLTGLGTPNVNKLYDDNHANH
jgi:subtilase family serine protease